MVSHVFPLAALSTLSTLSTLWRKMEIAEKEEGLAAFDTDILNTFFFFFLPTAAITARLTSKISANLPIVEGLTGRENSI